MLPHAVSPQVTGGVVICHPDFPVAIRIAREPTLADQELEHRAHRPDCLQDLSRVGERVGGAKKPTLSADETDDRAPVGREAPTTENTFVAGDYETRKCDSR
jgi:hypothetical protein